MKFKAIAGHSMMEPYPTFLSHGSSNPSSPSDVRWAIRLSFFHNRSYLNNIVYKERSHYICNYAPTYKPSHLPSQANESILPILEKRHEIEFFCSIDRSWFMWSAWPSDLSIRFMWVLIVTKHWCFHPNSLYWKNRLCLLFLGITPT